VAPCRRHRDACPSALYFSGFDDVRLLASTSAAVAAAVNDDELKLGAVALALADEVVVVAVVVVVVAVEELVRLFRSSPWLLLPVSSSSWVVDVALGLFAVFRLFVFRPPSSVGPHIGPACDGDFRLPPPPPLSSSELELLDDLRVHNPPSVGARVNR
jgi:hypothetical protein